MFKYINFSMIIWIASYPKSGNTWVRSLLASYYFSNDGKFNFNLLKNIKQFPSKNFFNKRIESIDEAAKSWLTIQRKIKSLNKVSFLKTHNVYGAYKGMHFTTPEFTLGAIIIVRDPRNVITSLMNHYSINEEGALEMIKSVYRNLKDKNDLDNYASYSFISSWENNYKSWKNSNIQNKLIIKYEDLEKNTANTFETIIQFVNKSMKNEDQINKKKLNISVETTNFEKMKKMEEKFGFEEASYTTDGKKIAFFNLGKDNDHKKLLSTKSVKELEKVFEKEMKDLKYL